jgi:hypothetical protein
VQVPELYNEEVIIIPNSGMLKAMEKKNLEVNFIPLRKKKYKIEVPIALSSSISDNTVGYHAPGSGSR